VQTLLCYSFFNYINYFCFLATAIQPRARTAKAAPAAAYPVVGFESPAFEAAEEVVVALDDVEAEEEAETDDEAAELVSAAELFTDEDSSSLLLVSSLLLTASLELSSPLESSGGRMGLPFSSSRMGLSLFSLAEISTLSSISQPYSLLISSISLLAAFSCVFSLGCQSPPRPSAVS